MIRSRIGRRTEYRRANDSEWAENRPTIAEVWFFGSRVRGTAGPDRDLDVGVLLHSVDDYGAAIRLAAPWKDELTELLAVVVQVEIINLGFLRPEIRAAISERGLLVFRSDAAT